MENATQDQEQPCYLFRAPQEVQDMIFAYADPEVDKLKLCLKSH